MKSKSIFAAFVLAAIIAATSAAAPLRVGVLPDADSLPLLVARAEGIFAAEGIDAELVSFKTAVERDAALQAGAIDGAVSDLLAVAFASRAGFDIKATSLTDGRYGILVSPGSRIPSLAGLAGKRAVSAKRRTWPVVISLRLRLPPKLSARVSFGM